MANAYIVAKKILDIATQNGDIITNLKLQKLLYYAQAWYMVNNNGEQLFSDDIQAWHFGPVVPNVYKKYKKFKWHPIHDDTNGIDTLTKNQNVFLQEFCQKFLSCSATELVAMTHNEKPWQEASVKHNGAVISTDTMYHFYKSLVD